MGEGQISIFNHMLKWKENFLRLEIVILCEFIGLNSVENQFLTKI